MGQRTTRRNQGFGAFDPTGASSNCSPTFRAQPLRSNCANLARFAFLLHLLTTACGTNETKEPLWPTSHQFMEVKRTLAGVPAD